MDTNTNLVTIETTTIHVAPSIGTPSQCLPEGNDGMDYDVTITIGSQEIDGEVTLVPDDQTGRLCSWGAVDNWLSSPLVKAIDALGLGRSDAQAVYSAIVSACVSGDAGEVEIPTATGIAQ